MALNRDQMGLIFRLDADTKPAQQDLAAFKSFTDKLTQDVGKKAATNLDQVGKSSKASAKIVKESIETISSDIIGSFGVSGDIAGKLSGQISGLSGAALIAGGAFVGFTAILAGTAAALFSLAKSTANTLTDIGDLSEKTQISVETLSALKPTLEQNGASLDKFGGAIEELQQKIVKARNGNKELGDGFKKLGVDVQQGVEPALKQIVVRYNELPEGAERTAFATNVFGSAGEDLVLTLNSLNGSLDAHTEKMRELGLVVTPEAVKQAKAFDDQMKSLDRQFESFKLSVGSLVIPAFTSIIEQVNATIKSLRDLGSEFPRVSAALKLLAIGTFSVATGARVGPSDQDKINEDAANALAIEEELQRRLTGGGKKTSALPFGDGRKRGAGRAGLDAETQAKLQLFRIEEQAAARLADAEIAAARRALDEKAVSLDEYEAAVIASERRMIEAKQRTFAEERRLVEQSKLKGAPREAKLAEIGEREAAAEQRSSEAILRVLADTAKRREQLSREGEQIRERAAEEHARRLEEIAKLSDVRQIAEINAAADARVISEEQAALRIEAIRIAAFAREEDRLKAQLDKTRQRLAEQPKAGADPKILENERTALLAAEQRFVDELTVLQDQRANAEEEGSRRIEAARQKDLDDLFRVAQEQKRIYEEMEAARLRAAQSAFGATQFFGQAFGETLRRTGSEMEAFRALVQEFSIEISDSITPLNEIGARAFDGFAQGIGSIVEQFVLLGETGPAALRKLLAATLATIAAEAAVNAIKQLALGFGALFLNPPQAAAHFKSAALWGVVAAAAGVAGRAVAPAAGGSSAAGASGSTDRRDRRVIDQDSSTRQREAQVIIIRAEYQPGVIVREVTRDYAGNGNTRALFRNDMLGEPAG